jgi:hypothetical protein
MRVSPQLRGGLCSTSIRQGSNLRLERGDDPMRKLTLLAALLLAVMATSTARASEPANLQLRLAPEHKVNLMVAGTYSRNGEDTWGGFVGPCYEYGSRKKSVDAVRKFLMEICNVWGLDNHFTLTVEMTFVAFFNTKYVAFGIGVAAMTEHAKEGWFLGFVPTGNLAFHVHHRVDLIFDGGYGPQWKLAETNRGAYSIDHYLPIGGRREVVVSSAGLSIQLN